MRTTGDDVTDIAVYEGHGFTIGDKLIVTNTAGTDFTSLRYRTVSDIDNDANTITVSSIVDVTENELLINLGPDTGGGSPNYDASPINIYNNVYDFKTAGTFPTAISDATVTIGAEGRYGYWTADQRIWELIRLENDDPILLLPDVLPDTEVQRVLDVRQFGARGNGVNDDTEAIQAAIDAAHEQGTFSGPAGTGGVVYFPGGVYYITDTLVLRDRVSLVGSGVGTTYLYADFDDNDKAMVQAPNPGYSTDSGNRISDVLIEGLSFRKTGDGEDCIAIDLSQVTHGTIRKCSVYHASPTDATRPGVGIKVANIAYSIRVEDTTVSNCTIGILVANGANGATFQNCHVLNGYTSDEPEDKYARTNNAIVLRAGPDADLIGINLIAPRLEKFHTGVKLEVDGKVMADVLILAGHIENGFNGVDVAESGVTGVLILWPHYTSMVDPPLSDPSNGAVDWEKTVGIRGLRIGERTSTGGIAKALQHYSPTDSAVLFRDDADSDSVDLGVPWWKPGQVVKREFTAMQTGVTASFVQNDSIPQITAGTLAMSAAITPASSGSILRVRASAMIAGSAAADAQMALFRDTTADAFAAVSQRLVASGECNRIEVESDIWADSTNSTLISARLGTTAGTLTQNGSGGSRLFGGTARSFIEIVEYRPPKSTLTTWPDVLRTLPILVLYLADDLAAGSVTTWTDKGPYGQNLTQATSGNRPTCVASAFNGHNVVRFDGTNDRLVLAGGITPMRVDEAHLFQVLKVNNDPPGLGVTGWGDWPEIAAMKNEYPNTSGDIKNAFARSACYNIGNPGTSLASPHIFEVASTPAHWVARINGSQQGSTQTTDSVSWPTASVLGSNSVPDNFFAGDVACFLVLHKELGSYWAGELRGFLTEYYGL